MTTTTTNYAFDKPTVGGDTDLWGALLNSNADKLDALLSGTQPITGADLVSAKISSANAVLTGGSVTNMDVKNGNVEALRLTVAKNITETVALVGGAAPVINTDLGTIVAWNPTPAVANTPTIAIQSGQSVLLQMFISPAWGVGTIVWGGPVTWINGVPTPEANKSLVCVFWRIGTTTYGTMVGKSA